MPDTFKDLGIAPSPRRRLAEPGFGARVSAAGDRLEVPPPLAWALEALRVRTAGGLVSSSRAFPSVLVARLAWDVRQVNDHLPALVAVLRGHVADELLDAPPVGQFGFGAVIDDD